MKTTTYILSLALALFIGIKSNAQTLTATDASAIQTTSAVMNGSYTGVPTFGLQVQYSTDNFASHTPVALTQSDTAGNSMAILVEGLLPNTTYSYRFAAFYTELIYSNVITFTTLGDNQASDITFSNLNTTSVDLNWTNGSGIRRIVIAKQGIVDAIPADGSTYAANSTYGSGEEIGTGNFVVFDGIGSSTTISGLTANTTYEFKVFEYTGSAGSEVYKTDGFTATNPNSVTTLKNTPTLQASSIVFNTVGSTSMDLEWTPGDGDQVILVAKQGSAILNSPTDGMEYAANAGFGLGETIASDEYVVYKGNGTAVSISNLIQGTNYHFRLFEYNNSGTETKYLTSSSTDNPNNNTTLFGAPTTQASNITFNTIGSTNLNLSFTPGSGQNRIVVAALGASVDAVPVDGTTYTANNAFGLGDEIITGNFVVYNGAESNVNITGLAEGQTYTIKVFEYSNTDANTIYKIDGFTASNPISQSTIKGEPNLQANEIQFSNISDIAMDLNLTRGNGDSVMIIGRAGSLVDEFPLDGRAYTHNTVFGAGQDMGNGNFVLYNGTASNISISGLTANTTYYFRAFEYNNGQSNSNYNISSGVSNNPNSQNTLEAPPSPQASDILASNINTTSYTLNWTNGGGTGRIVIAKQGSVVDQEPSGGTSYAANENFGSGQDLGGGNFVVYAGTASTVDITGLTAGETYHFKVFEYNDGGLINYNLSDNTGNPISQATLSPLPTIQTSGINFTDIQATQVSFDWTNGNGSGRIIVARQSSPINSNPLQEINYTANSEYGLGDEIGSGNFVVYNGTGNSATITGLNSTTSYFFRIYEYNNSGEINYITTQVSGNPSSATTLAAGPPTVQTADIAVSNYEETSLSLDWTNGDGNRRIIAVKEGDQGTITNPTDLTTYGSNSAFGLGDQLGSSGYYIVYNGSGNNVTVTGLSQNTSYWVQSFEYNNGAGEQVYLTTTASGNPANYNTLKPAPGTQVSSISLPTIGSSSITLNWVNGDGDNRIVLINTTSTFLTPTDDTDYVANSVYSGSGEQVIYNGSGSSATVTGLAPGGNYFFKIYEYNNASAYSRFKTDGTDNTAATSTKGPSNWNGSVSSDWNNNANWTTGEVPIGVDAVYIYAAAPIMPVISSTQTIESLFVENGANLSIADGGDLSVNFDADFDASSTVNIQGNGSLTISQNANFGTSATLNIQNSGSLTVTQDLNLAANATATLETGTLASINANATIGAGGLITLQDGATFNVAQNATFEASTDASQSGSLLITGSGAFNVGGTSYMQRYIPSSNSHLFSSPVSAPSVSDFSYYYVGEYDEANTVWNYLTSESSMQKVKGYEILKGSNPALPHTLTFGGTLNNGDQSIAVSNSDLSDVDEIYGWNLVGNPYPSTVDLEASGWTRTNVDATVYTYNGSTYDSYNHNTRVGSGSRYIAPMQGFFVHVSGASTGTYGLSNSVRVANTASFKNTKAMPAKIDLIVANSHYNSSTSIVFYPEATPLFDTEFDGYKLLGYNDSVPEIYTHQDDMYSINTFPLDTLSSMDVGGVYFKLGLKAGNATALTISASDFGDLPENVEVILVDLEENIQVDLLNESYSFSTLGINNNRFQVVFKPKKIYTQTLNISTDGDLTSVAQNSNLQCYVEVLPEYTSNKTVTWSVDKPQIASIDASSGLLSGLQPGTVIVTATANDGSQIEASVEIDVYTPVILVSNIEVATATGTDSVEVNATLQLSANVSPDNASTATVTWEVANQEVASINQTGLLTGKNTGTTLVKATANDGSTIYGELLITVYNFTSIDENTASRFTLVYPNPTTEWIKLESNETKCTFKLYNSLGKIVNHGQFNRNTTIDMRLLNNGMYYLEIRQGQNIQTEVIIKQ